MTRVIDEMTDEEIFLYLESRYPSFFFVGKPREHDKEHRDMSFRAHGYAYDRWAILKYAEKAIEDITNNMFYGDDNEFGIQFDGEGE